LLISTVGKLIVTAAFLINAPMPVNGGEDEPNGRSGVEDL
jgi:hypothetical protein